MDKYAQFIESGILELYVMEMTSAEENITVARMLKESAAVRAELEEISIAMERFAQEHAIQPNPVIKPFLLATIDFTERLKKGEVISEAPLLTENAKPSDYEQWLNRPDMVLPYDFESIHAKIISYTPTLLTAIVWIREMAPQEVHDNEYEKFLILEGTCDITIDEQVHSLKAGDYLSIPLHKNHHVTVTSSEPCKVILQRLAA